MCLAEVDGEALLRVDDIAAELDVPRNYLSKILHMLAREGVLESTRGPGGGFRLAAPPEQVHLTDVVRHFDEVPDAASCLLGRDECLDSDPCAAHARWRNVGAAVQSFLSETRLSDLMAEGSASPPGAMD
jgi:Rrf2 family iron-sulfur cluster assembly transcriptional regulator